MTPFYEQDGITIYHGDNVAVMRELPGESIDLVVTSPPYDNLRAYGGHSWDFPSVAEQLTRLLKPGGVIVWIVADATIDGSETGTSMRQALHFKDVCGLNLHDTMIWEKIDPAPGDGKFRYHDAFEYCFIISRGTPKARNLIRDVRQQSPGKLELVAYDRRVDETNTARTRKPFTRPEFGFRRNIWKTLNGSSQTDAIAQKHPAVFPESLARDHILSWSNPGDVVLDPFNGSGTTMKMAKENGRRGIGIEINEKYCDIAVKRLAQGVLFGAEGAA